MIYEINDFRYLMKQWRAGTLDSHVDPGCPQVGMLGVVVTARGTVGQTLVQRFTLAEISQALRLVFLIDPVLAGAVILVDAFDQPLEVLASVVGCKCSEAGSLLSTAQDLVMETLYVQEHRQKDRNQSLLTPISV